MYKFKEGLAWYKNNRKEVIEFEEYLICFHSVDDWIENPTDEEYLAITTGAIKAYHDDESGNELSIFSDFLAEGVAGGYFSLNDIACHSGFAIGEAALEHNFYELQEHGGKK